MKKLIILLSLICLLSGCSFTNQKNTVEEIAPVTFLTVKEGEDKGNIAVSTLVPPALDEERQFFSAEVKLLEQARKEFNMKYYREIRLGQLRVLFIDEKIANSGIVSLIDMLLTDQEVSHRVFLVVTKGDIESFVNKQMKKQKDLDYYLYRMLKHYERDNQGEITVTDIHEFMEKFYTPFSDPFIPVFNMEEDHFNYEGTGLFRNGKLVGQIDKEQDQFFQLLSPSKSLKNMVIDPLDVSLGEVRSKVETQVNLANNTVTLKVHYRGNIDEYHGKESLDSKESFYQLIDEIESYLKEENVSLLKKFQELKVDPLEIGRQATTPISKPMSEEDWRKFWESANIKVECHLQLEPLSI
ncbi:Ger(x)C family spore germination protein [Bacillus lacus]|uniref:Ger(X)C family spore germination protein n=1 Tax=Metabacillus lacus TaxID=1983721 RepID=A0A7X2J3J3_9BACI|nr:Ger(x)C family spore germination protein [Metabacillus lacus]MRX74188.1 Ger(x)C family spore germination protein [Metabacillus lacus]